MSKATRKESAIAITTIEGRDEMNFAEFPIALLSDRATADQSCLQFSHSIRDKGTGEVVPRTLTIEAPESCGLPMAKDDEVILALIELTRRHGFRDRKVSFTQHELLNLMRWPIQTASYRRLRESMFRWLKVTLDYKRAWWDKNTQSWVDQGFHIIDNVEWNRSGISSYFVWNTVVFESFQAGNLKPLDLDFYFFLESSIAKRIFRFLDKRFHWGHRIHFGLELFALEHIGLGRGSCTRSDGSIHMAKIKEKLAPGIAELEAAKFIRHETGDKRYRSMNRREWTVFFTKGNRRPVVPETIPASAATVEHSPIVQTMVAKLNVTADIAAELVEEHGQDKVFQQMNYLEERQSGKGAPVGNPAGFVIDRLQKNFTPPGSVTPRGQWREKQAATAKGNAQQRELNQLAEQESAVRRSQLAAETCKVNEYISKLTEAERDALRDEQQATGQSRRLIILKRLAASPA